METLFIIKTIHGWYLKDAKDFTLGHFNTSEDAIAWCKENGYRWRLK